MNKHKIFNDPVYGFISIPYEIVYDVIQHPAFQRLRRIQQLGMSSLVYPGATHSRFHHSLGAMHLMNLSLQVLKSKKITITNDECVATILAILLHDIGHGPFSHSLEKVLIADTHHEEISLLIMKDLQKQFGNPIKMAIAIFENKYPKKFLHQLVSGQLDMDRMDYLNRDSFYSGVSEGVIGYDRIINMLNVHNDNIVVEEKGIYSIEKFLVARRLMYWQVYLHKTSLVADWMLKLVILRAKEIGEKAIQNGISDALKIFLQNKPLAKNLAAFLALDDNDIIQALKIWTTHEDDVLRRLSDGIINRNLYKLEFGDKATIDTKFKALTKKIPTKNQAYFLMKSTAKNNAYNPTKDKIFILFKDNTIKEITEITEQLDIRSLTNAVTKHFIIVDKNIL